MPNLSKLSSSGALNSVLKRTGQRNMHAMSALQQTDFDPVRRAETIKPSRNPFRNPKRRSVQEILTFRQNHMLNNLSVSYSSAPLKIVRGAGTYLYDENGNRYLDCVNNVAHVGHSHPRVVSAITTQAAQLNTNTRYLHDTIMDYGRQLLESCPPGLDVVTFVCSGSEANDLALRMARAYTGRKGVVCVQGGYHGATGSVVEVSHYKYASRGGDGQQPYVRHIPIPDLYRGEHSGDNAGELYAAAVKSAAESLTANGYAPAAFITESAYSVAGYIPPPQGFLKAAFQHARDAGAVVIADEVQVGLGRGGAPNMWYFEKYDAVPDIITVGKGLGNGHPLAAVITTKEVAEAFGTTGLEYFNTFGGNPVSMAAGQAVLQVLEEEDLINQAAEVGDYITDLLRALQSTHECIGDVRGSGLFIGFELVKDRDTKEPATELTSLIVNAMKENHRILLSTDGPFNNIIKIKPPMVFGHTEAQIFAEALDDTLISLSKL